mgnify:CR=1 FL=1
MKLQARRRVWLKQPYCQGAVAHHLEDPHLPLKPVDLHLLLSLAEGELHGYGLVKAIEAASDGLIRLDPGNLYRVIKRLLEQGLIAESDGPEGDKGSERRKYYRLTVPGKRVLARELERLTALTRSHPVRALMRRWATT